MKMCVNCHCDPVVSQGLCVDCVVIRKKLICKQCGKPGHPHNYRHPFVPKRTKPVTHVDPVLSEINPQAIFNMPIVISNQEKWDKRFLLLADHVSSWSKDPSTKVGSVIVDAKRRVVGVGYNGFPRGVDDDLARYADRAQKYPRVAHAELNAILNSVSTEGATLYCNHIPCCECAKAIIQAGISALVVPESDSDMDPDRWGDSVMIAWEMFEEAGLDLRTA